MKLVPSYMQQILDDRLKVGPKKVTVRVEVDKLVYTPNAVTELDYAIFETKPKLPEVISPSVSNITSAAYLISPIKDEPIATVLGIPDGMTSPVGSVAGKVTSPFGMRWHPIQNTEVMHEGIDLGYGQGTSVCASADGVVTQVVVAYEPRYITILHTNSVCTRYMHISNPTVRDGQQVTQGQVIAEIGPTDSYSTGPHLHYEVRTGATKMDDGTAVDPVPYLTKSVTLSYVGTTQEGTPTTWSTDCSANLRSGPSMDASVIRVMSTGTQLTKLGQTGEWCHVRTSDGIEAYTHESNLQQISGGNTPTGGNPSHIEVFNYINVYCNSLGLPSQVGLSTAWKESEWTQFDSSGSVYVSGEDYGIMQLNKSSHPSAFPQCETDWQYNVRYGLELAYTHYKTACGMYSDEVSRARSTYSAYNTGSNYTRWATESDARDTGFYSIYQTSPWNSSISGGTGGAPMFGRVTDEIVNIRSSSENRVDNILINVNKGVVLEHYGLTSGWYKVSLPDGRLGFIPESSFAPIHDTISTDYDVEKVFSDDFEKYTVYSIPTSYKQDSGKAWKVEFDGTSNCLVIKDGGKGVNSIELLSSVTHSGRFDMYYKVDLVENNALQVYVDGNLVHTKTGTVDLNYTMLSIPLSMGTHTIKLVREKNVDGNDSIKIDNLAVYSYTYVDSVVGTELAKTGGVNDIAIVKSDMMPIYSSKDTSGEIVDYVSRGTIFSIEETDSVWTAIKLPNGVVAYLSNNKGVSVQMGGGSSNQLGVHAGGYTYDRTLVLDSVISVNIDRKYDMRAASAQVVIENFLGYHSPDARFNSFLENTLHKSPFVDYVDGNPEGVLSENTPIRIYLGYGDNPPRKFTGLIDAVDISGDGQTLTIRCTDMMKKLNNYYNYKNLEYPPKEDSLTKNPWLVSSVLNDMAIRAGMSGWRVVDEDLYYPDIIIEESWYAEVKADSGHVMLKDEKGESYEALLTSIPIDGGYFNPYKWGGGPIKEGTCFGDKMDEICQELGYWQRCDDYGTYRCTPIKKDPLPVAYFKDTENIVSLDKTIDYTKTKNHIIITGVGGSEHFFDLDLWKSVKGEHRSFSINVPWANSIGKKKVVAEKMFEDMKIQSRTLQCSIEGNPYIELMDTIGIEHLKSATSSLYHIKGIRDSWDINSGYITNVDLYWMGVN